MKAFKYRLEPYNGRASRYDCPQCGTIHKNTFVRYIDIETGNHLHKDVGKCNRQDKCGHHYTPQMYFKVSGTFGHQTLVDVPIKPIQLPSQLPKELINCEGERNHLFTYMLKRFPPDAVKSTFQRYMVGSSRKWERSTVFYQFDKYKHCRTGKIMQYNPNTGKRIKEPYSRIAWLHTGIENYNLKQCLFGEHLVRMNESTPLAIVESEKTALIMATLEPQYIWLATGGLSNLNKNKVSGLGFRKIVLFPDSGCADKWSEKVKDTDVHVCYDLEIFPIGSDLADVI